MPTYATIVDFKDFSESYATSSDADITAALEEAERDIDAYANLFPGDTGLAFVPGDLSDIDSAALNRATCAQAEYRLYMGPAFFIEQQQYREVGGDVTTGRASRYGPRMKQEFPSYMRSLTGRMT